MQEVPLQQGQQDNRDREDRIHRQTGGSRQSQAPMAGNWMRYGVQIEMGHGCLS
jgi:hypothetical protein